MAIQKYQPAGGGLKVRGGLIWDGISGVRRSKAVQGNGANFHLLLQQEEKKKQDATKRIPAVITLF